MEARGMDLTACSSVRNAFWQHLRDSIEKGTDAATFTYNMNKIYIRMAGPNYNQCLLLLRNIVLRCFIFDNPNALWAEEDPNQDDSASDNRLQSEAKFPWSLVDSWFASKQDLGRKLTDPAWKELLEEYVQFDENGFQKRPQGQPPLQGAQAALITSGLNMRGSSTLGMLI
ncbi:hypothetical protein EV359DRAFT_69210 [Lentinula novae-zelandiae]|nr:hypothetical protein EV359DRAFT_69210 [Lentinula novae-zelandiae]